MSTDKQTKPQRGFKGIWITRDLYLLKGYSWKEKILLCEIDSLDNDEEKGCYATNEYLASFLGDDTSAGTVANMISSLRKRGAIHDVFSDGKNRGLRSLLHRPDAKHKALAEVMEYVKAKDDLEKAVVPEPGPMPEPLTLIDPEKTHLIAETEKALGLLLPILTQERINLAVPAEFTTNWLDFIRDRMIGHEDADSSFVNKRLGYWLTDFKNNLWRFRKDAEMSQPKPAVTTNAPSGADFSFCDLCDIRGMRTIKVDGVDRLTKCDHAGKRRAA